MKYLFLPFFLTFLLISCSSESNLQTKDNQNGSKIETKNKVIENRGENKATIEKKDDIKDKMQIESEDYVNRVNGMKREYSECKKDTDCIDVIKGCCPCSSGGRTISINKNYLEKFKKNYKNCAKKRPKCLQVYRCMHGESVCNKKRGICEYKEGKRKIKGKIKF